jgi:hypothetical protein
MYRKLICLLTLISMLAACSVVQAALAEWETAISDANPLHWYKFDETSTDCIDHGSGSLNGIYEGVSLGQEGLFGAGTAVGFERSGANRATFTGATDLSCPWTVEYIVKTTKAPAGTDAQCLHDSTTTSIRLAGYTSLGEAGFTLYGVADYQFTPAAGLTLNDLVIQQDVWVHLVWRNNGSGTQFFIDGQLVATTADMIDLPRLTIGGRSGGTSDQLQGVLDEAVVFDRALTNAEILAHASMTYPVKATNPQPEDGAIHADTWVSLSWKEGDLAVSHDVYFGDDFDNVNNGLGGTFRGRCVVTYFDIGLPGTPYPNGLAPGTTYYWRIDEIEANGTTKHKGNVWSFMTGSQNAYNPFPSNGSKFVDLDVTLSWTTGFGDVSHNVYLGDDFDDVSEGLGDTFRVNQHSASLDIDVLYPDGLIPNKTYYWRIDEVESGGGMTYKGDVWSFTATIPGLGTIVQEIWYDVYSDSLEALKKHWKYPDQPDETTVLTRFETGDNLGENYGGRIHGWLYAPLTGDYTFWICSDDQGELWLSKDDEPRNVGLIAYVKDSPTAVGGWAPRNIWTKYASQKSSPVKLTAGNKYYIMALWKEGLGDDHCQVAWDGPGISGRTIIPGCYLSAEPVGTYPQPADGARIGNKTPVLSWNPREAGVAYDVYLGTNFYLVNTVNRYDQSGIYRGRWIDASYATEELVLGRTYYWRIDEVEANGWTINKGSVWSFTIVDVDTIEYQVSASEDDGYASNDSLQNLSSDYMRAGLSSFAGPPYYMSGMVFRNVNIPQGTEIISAHLKICSHDNRLDDVVYGKVEAEAADDAGSFGGSRHIGSLPRTGASVNWDHYEPWDENTWYESPDIAGVIQEVIDRAGWSSNNSLTILYSTRDNEGGYRNFSSYDRGGNLAPKLEITYVPR